MVRPAQVEDIELVQPAGALALDVHAFEKVGVAFGIEDDHHFVLSAALATNVLRDEQFGQPGLADPRGS
ncbi:hypothetical protein D3C84_847790 [compost metagenome]